MSEIVDEISKVVKLRESGVVYLGLCPFHEEITPSFSVRKSTERFHCYGCGVDGDLKEFLKLMEEKKEVENSDK